MKRWRDEERGKKAKANDLLTHWGENSTDMRMKVNEITSKNMRLWENFVSNEIWHPFPLLWTSQSAISLIAVKYQIIFINYSSSSCRSYCFHFCLFSSQFLLHFANWCQLFYWCRQFDWCIVMIMETKAHRMIEESSMKCLNRNYARNEGLPNSCNDCPLWRHLTHESNTQTAEMSQVVYSLHIIVHVYMDFDEAQNQQQQQKTASALKQASASNGQSTSSIFLSLMCVTQLVLSLVLFSMSPIFLENHWNAQR